MNLPEAIKVLEEYNKWRRGDEEIKQPNPKVIGEAIDVAIHLLKQMK